MVSPIRESSGFLAELMNKTDVFHNLHHGVNDFLLVSSM